MPPFHYFEPTHSLNPPHTSPFLFVSRGQIFASVLPNSALLFLHLGWGGWWTDDIVSGGCPYSLWESTIANSPPCYPAYHSLGVQPVFAPEAQEVGKRKQQVDVLYKSTSCSPFAILPSRSCPIGRVCWESCIRPSYGSREFWHVRSCWYRSHRILVSVSKSHPNSISYSSVACLTINSLSGQKGLLGLPKKLG